MKPQLQQDGLSSLLLYLGIAWASSFFILTLINRSKLNPKRLPPSPFPLPVLGNIFSLIGTQLLPHKSLAKLAQSYGPVMSLQLGFQTTIVISSASMAKEVLQTNDASFANRTVPDALTALQHHEFSVVLRPADKLWRTYRKICISHVFSGSRLDATHVLRKNKVQQLLSHIQSCCDSRKPVNIPQSIFTTTLNFLSNTFFSIDLDNPNSTALATEFKRLITNMSVESGTPNVVDFFPILKLLDPQGIKKRSVVLVHQILNIFDTIIKERIQSRNFTSPDHKDVDVLDALLTLAQEPGNDLHLPDLPHLLFDLFGAGTDTSSSSIEWAMAELLRNPEKMRKAQTELEKVIGNQNAVEENDLIRLPYLRAVVKETLRLHPPAPLLLPRKVFNDTSLDGFVVPKNSQVLVNVYAIGRDPNLWPNPNSFEPERFLGSSIDFKGQDFELLPFGSGRRICPGLPLANKMLHWMLGSLIHSFDWKLDDGSTPNNLNMDEKIGITLHKAKSLYAIPLTK